MDFERFYELMWEDLKELDKNTFRKWLTTIPPEDTQQRVEIEDVIDTLDEDGWFPERNVDYRLLYEIWNSELLSPENVRQIARTVYNVGEAMLNDKQFHNF